MPTLNTSCQQVLRNVNSFGEASPNSNVDLREIPTPVRGERPTEYANRVGEWYVEHRSDTHRKEHGLYLTPIAVADYMGSDLCGKRSGKRKKLRLLDPAAGAGILICAAVEGMDSCTQRLEEVHVVAYEIDQQLAAVLEVVLKNLAAWCEKAHSFKLRTTIYPEDFVLKHSRTLDASETLFSESSSEQLFDLIVSNPPYFKLPKSDPRSIAAASVVHGQPNIYALFMAVSAAMLRSHGNMVFIVPRSFASGPYFCKFRSVFFKMIKPVHVHVFSSRRATFSRDRVLQENIILFGSKDEQWHAVDGSQWLKITSSNGSGDLAEAKHHLVPLSNSLRLDSSQKVLRLPLNTYDDAVLDVIDSWVYTLASFGLNISTGPVVPFRANEFIDNKGNVARGHVPLLWMNHVKALEVRWPLNQHKREFIRSASSDSILVENKNYVLLRRFSAKEEARRLIAAPYLSCHYSTQKVGFENHLNYIHRSGGELSQDEAWGLAVLYSSAQLNSYFRIVNGNTQVSATEIRALPLPSMETIKAIGRAVRALPDPLAEVDAITSTFIPSFRSARTLRG